LGGCGSDNKMVRSLSDPLGVFGDPPKKQRRGTIDPTAGIVTGTGRSNLDSGLTDYLRTGEWTLDGKGKRLRDIKYAIDQMRQRGYE